MVTVRSVIAVVVHSSWPLYQIDLHNVFVQGDLNEEVYMTIPLGFSKDAARQGVSITGNDANEISNTRRDLQKLFKMKDLGELKFFIGIEFARSHRVIYMSQRKYALGLISELGLAGAKPASTPLEVNQKPTCIDFDQLVGPSDGMAHDAALRDAGEYHRLVDRLLYLTITRPDISFAMQTLSQFMHAPKQSHMDVAIRVVRYIKSAPGQGLLLPTEGNRELRAYCDIDWGECLQTRRSVTGYLVFYGDALISWKSKKTRDSGKELS
nr:uncharacterized mitochondrial protein AtMg00810-like [Nicotiana tomentosiformis]